MAEERYGDVSVALSGSVAEVEIHRPPHNFLDVALIRSLADALEALDRAPDCRVSVLCAEGKNFCAGANFAARETEAPSGAANPLYAQAVRLFSCKKPVVAAVQGAAVGGGVGLALVADFRVVSPEARFSTNFVKLGIHPGFGLSHTLPRLIGQQKAALMFYTGRRIPGQEAVAWGLADLLADAHRLRAVAAELAAEIAEGAPLALLSTRATLRQGLAEAVKAQTDHEAKEQARLFRTADHHEGVKAVAERRPGRFLGK